MNIKEYIQIKYKNMRGFDKEEIGYVYDLIKNIDNDLLRNKFLALVILTESGKENYRKFINYFKTDIANLSELELLEYLELIFKYVLDYVTLSYIYNIVSRYLYITGEREREDLFDLVDKYCIEHKKYKSIKKHINGDPKNVLFKIYHTLIDKKLDIVRLEHLVNKYCTNMGMYYDYKINITVLKNIMEILYNLEDNERNNRIKYTFLSKVYMYLDDRQKDSLIRNDIKNGKLIISSINSSKHCNVVFDDFEVESYINIISVKDDFYPCIDHAFSIDELDGIYTLCIYIADVPSFLDKNPVVLKEAYEKGTSMYLDIQDKGVYNIDIIPMFLSHKYLSFNERYPKNAIKLKFIINKEGEVLSKEISRTRIIVSKTISIHDDFYINSDIEVGLIGVCLKRYKAFVESLKQKNVLLTNINTNNLRDLLSVNSLITNYYIGSINETGIYLNNGIYTSEKGSGYAISNEPLRRFVSNINLAFFLRQNNLTVMDDKYLTYVQDNIDEIVDHLNRRELIADFANQNGRFVRRYLKREY
jgi:hypothetical protein